MLVPVCSLLLILSTPSECVLLPSASPQFFSQTVFVEASNQRRNNDGTSPVWENPATEAKVGAWEELRTHFSGMSSGSIDRLEERLKRVKEAIYQLEYENRGNRTFSHEMDTDKSRPVTISSAQPNLSADMASFLFEGDILLTSTQIGSILEHLGEKPRIPFKRSLSADPDALWRQLPIKFRFHESLEFTAIQQIAEAIAYWENNSCIRFEHLEQEPPAEEQKPDGDSDYVEFFKGQGCYSMIGRYGGRQGISIGAGCERVVGIVEHEIGHLLGLWHEQSRPDAWKYVRVEKQFVVHSYMGDFQLRGDDEILTLGLPYDYGSVMHYGPTAFSLDGTKMTLITKNALFQSTIGQRDRLAFYDLMTINKAYCADKCGGIPQLVRPFAHSFSGCANGGYPNPSRCSECICPSGYGGEKCEKPEQAKNANCGGEVVVATDRWKVLESPNYEGDGYEQGQHCNWIVRSPLGTRIRVEFIDDFSLFCATICVDYVEVKLAKDQRLTGPRFCCDQKFEGNLVSEYSQMAVLFRAQLAQDVGFRLRVKATSLPPTNQRTGLNPESSRNLQKSASIRAPFAPGKNVWSDWGAWSACSRPCGGCGIRSRVRACLSAECPGDNSQEFSACNFHACPVRPSCQKVLFLNRLCQSSLSNSTAICTQLSHQLVECNQPSCCPPFFALNGKCITEEFDEGTAVGSRN